MQGFCRLKELYIMLLENIDKMHKKMYASGNARYVNQGGCGKMAVTIAYMLETYYNITAEIVFVCYDSAEYINRKANINKTNVFRNLAQFISESEFDHIMVRFCYKNKTYYVDATNIFAASDIHRRYKYIFKGSISRKTLISISKHNEWNSFFEDHASPKQCRQIIRAALKK